MSNDTPDTVQELLNRQPMPEEAPETTLDALTKKQQKKVAKVVSYLLDKDPCIGLEVTKVILYKLATLHRNMVDDKTEKGDDCRTWVYDLARIDSAIDDLRDVRL